MREYPAGICELTITHKCGWYWKRVLQGLLGRTKIHVFDKNDLSRGRL